LAAIEDFRGLLRKVTQRSKLKLAQCIQQLVLTPTKAAEGSRFDV
jgi:hypothetical protein